MTAAISVHNLAKRYRVSSATPRGHYRTLRESLASVATAPLRRIRNRSLYSSNADFWALKNVSFQVAPGEVIGIIGRNGAGKSTLLKVLSRITEPSRGEVRLKGRIGSLLEVGTGFHPELSGRENIYLNGSILGMSRREIDRRFDSIVAFAEVESFLDTPVKRYSSGMYVRLAFAVASHLDPELLLVDEVLAVGDVEFQKKCMGRMSEIGREGRTVLFISHNMHAIARLARRSILLNNGTVLADGQTSDVIRTHLSAGGALTPEWTRPHLDTSRSDVDLISIRSCDLRGKTSSRFAADETFYIEIGFRANRETSAQVAFRLNSNSDSTTVFTSALSDAAGERSSRFAPGTYTSRCRVPAHLLSPGSYHLLVAVNNPRGAAFDLVEQVLEFEVTDIGSLTCFDGRLGHITPLLDWDLSHRDSVRDPILT